MADDQRRFRAHGIPVAERQDSTLGYEVRDELTGQQVSTHSYFAEAWRRAIEFNLNPPDQEEDDYQS